ncbi:hypothetical protein FVE85_5091 [Porphyridium purpureum]|uniref:Uncharacterized protein n=1 Tax=Porphyridium purpureum TaxID=35688 RepID=A0A5J4Z1L1_PORPP|nr:hypothetical protein FVE85_5091 [Porphyridium purpureum]|eukprot:POR6414..scf295_1
MNTCVARTLHTRQQIRTTLPLIEKMLFKPALCDDFGPGKSQDFGRHGFSIQRVLQQQFGKRTRIQSNANFKGAPEWSLCLSKRSRHERKVSIICGMCEYKRWHPSSALVQSRVLTL